MTPYMTGQQGNCSRMQQHGTTMSHGSRHLQDGVMVGSNLRSGRQKNPGHKEKIGHRPITVGTILELTGKE
eukprot:7762777-Karenia_brevis.AAC.1